LTANPVNQLAAVKISLITILKRKQQTTADKTSIHQTNQTQPLIITITNTQVTDTRCLATLLINGHFFAVQLDPLQMSSFLLFSAATSSFLQLFFQHPTEVVLFSGRTHITERNAQYGE